MPVIPVTFQDTGRFTINPDDLFVTPHAVAQQSIAAFKKLTKVDYEASDYQVLDAGCGTGRWGHAVNEELNFPMSWGVDIRRRLDYPEDCINPEPYDYYVIQDYLTYTREKPFSLITGNPPFSSDTNRALAEDFILHSFDLLKDGGHLAFLLKTEFFSSERRMENLFRKHVPKYFIQYVPRVKWDGFQFSNTIEYGFFIWQKGRKFRNTTIKWLNWKTKEMI